MTRRGDGADRVGAGRMKLGINLWSQASTWRQLREAARRVDALGYDTLWTWDHLYAIVGDPYQPIFEGWGVVHAFAEATERVRVGVLVGANTFRNPGVVAKQATTLDHVSGGRAILGLGGAWFELEHTAHGIDFGTGFGQRLDWLSESVAAVRALLDGETVTSPTGGRYAFREARHAPLPVQAHLPLMIGGTGRRKTLPIVARYADMWNALATIDDAAELNGLVDELCADAGRDAREIDRSANLWVAIRDTEADARAAWGDWMALNRADVADTVGPIRPLFGPPEVVAARFREYASAGFTSILIEMPAPYDAETIERLMGEVAPLLEPESVVAG